MNKGTFYKTIDGTQVDIWNITYNPDGTNLFDVEVLLPDSTVFTRENCFNYIKSLQLLNPIEDVPVSIKDNQNPDMFLSTYSSFYSNTNKGIKGNSDDKS